MKHAAPPVLSPEVALPDRSQDEDNTKVVGLLVRKKSAFDPYGESREFPQRWQAYLHAHFQNHVAVAYSFSVSEKAARNWWNGDGGCRGDKVAVAIGLHPDTAAVILFPGVAG